MRHEINQSEAAAIRRARAPKPISCETDSLTLEAEAAKGNRAAIERLEELRYHSAMELKYNTQ